MRKHPPSSRWLAYTRTCMAYTSATLTCMAWLATTPALANCGSILEPPNHLYPTKPNGEVVTLPLAKVHDICISGAFNLDMAESGGFVAACTISHRANIGPGIAWKVIYLPEVGGIVTPEVQACLLQHEAAHSWGWPDYHPGAETNQDLKGE